MANCFVIMPFRPELHYFYLSIKAHIEQRFPEVSVERGDDRVLTGPVLEKIADYIRQSDVVVADCSGRNPNVFYELGMAHALKKPVILVTSDPVEQAPTDIRAFEFVSYATDPDQFFEKLDSALESVFGDPYAALYAEALQLFDEFRQDRVLALVPAGLDQFSAAAAALVAAGQLVPALDLRARAEFLIRRLLGVEPSIDVLIALKDWRDQKFPNLEGP
jgi:nucleoside 2-deoxyribosyltransferase